MREETCCRHIGYSFRLTARVLLYGPSHRQDSTYHGLCYTSRGALTGTRNSSLGLLHEGSIRRPIAQRANALTTSLPIPTTTIAITSVAAITIVITTAAVTTTTTTAYVAAATTITCAGAAAASLSTRCWSRSLFKVDNWGNIIHL